MRATLKQLLHSELKTNKKIKIVTADLGYKMWDDIKKDYPENFINVNASEQLMLGTCIGLSYQGYIPIAYSITPFVLYRGFEFIRNYLHHENANVKLVGSGMFTDYSHDGFSHHDFTAEKILNVLGIECHIPEKKENLVDLFPSWISNPKPSFLGLRR
jgi:transketolase